jgi:hypothetical protein
MLRGDRADDGRLGIANLGTDTVAEPTPLTTLEALGGPRTPKLETRNPEPET